MHLKGGKLDRKVLRIVKLNLVLAEEAANSVPWLRFFSHGAQYETRQKGPRKAQMDHVRMSRECEKHRRSGPPQQTLTTHTMCTQEGGPSGNRPRVYTRGKYKQVCENGCQFRRADPLVWTHLAKLSNKFSSTMAILPTILQV